MSARPLPTAAELARMSAAWDWLHRLRQDAPSQDDLSQWQQWYESDERNKQAFDRARSFSQHIPRTLEGPHALQPALWRTAPPASAQRWRRTRRPAAWLGLALAAGLAAIAIHGTLNMQPATDMPAGAMVVAANGDIQQSVREADLPDGSHVELARKSTLSLQFSDKARLLDMGSGVAFFTVAHDRERPFIVRAGDFYVRAVGTAFNVRNTGKRLVVTVTDGTVDVYPATDAREVNTAAPGNALRVKAGKEVTWSEPAAAPSVANADPQLALAWRQGRLEFVNEPLSAAIVDINRYSTHRVVIGDPEVGKLEFSGAVQTDAADAWVRAVPQLLPVDLLDGSDGSVILVGRRKG